MKRKSGGKSPRNKGFSAEREIVNIAKAAGCEAKRTPCSLPPDIVINGRQISAKRRANGMEWAYKELDSGHDSVLFRADHKKWLEIRYWIP